MQTDNISPNHWSIRQKIENHVESKQNQFILLWNFAEIVKASLELQKLHRKCKNLVNMYNYCEHCVDVAKSQKYARKAELLWKLQDHPPKLAELQKIAKLQNHGINCGINPKLQGHVEFAEKKKQQHRMQSTRAKGELVPKKDSIGAVASMHIWQASH